MTREILAVRIGIVVWACVIVAGFLIWDRVEATPGTSGPTPPPRTPGRPTVVVFVHPHCPCTRAALPDLVAALRGDVRVVFVRPAGVPDGWERTRSWEIVAASGVAITIDVDGVEAATEGAETSGYAVARDASGRVAFRGGIGRGRAGPNPGLRTVVEVLAGHVPTVAETPVFGCPLNPR